jgi:hypothetical protein
MSFGRNRLFGVLHRVNVGHGLVNKFSIVDVVFLLSESQ